MLGYLGKGQLKGINIVYYGDVHNYNIWPITSSVLQGLFTRGYAEGINLINAKNTAEKLGIKVKEIKSSDKMDYKSCIEVKLNTSEGNLNILGTIFGKNDPRIVKFNGFEIDFVPSGSILICGNRDRPGIIGDIGTVLGKNGINIGHMTWARLSQAGDAVVVLNTDQKVTEGVITDIEKISGINWAKFLEL